MTRSRDFRIALLIGTAAALLGMVYVSTWGSTPHFFQELFGPAATVLGLSLPLWGLRWHQHVQVGRVLAAYDAAETEAVTVKARPLANGDWLVRGAHDEAGRDVLPGNPDTPYFEVDFLVATFDATGGPLPFEALYDGAVPDVALSWRGEPPATDTGPTRLFFPVYHTRWKGPGGGWTRYEGLRLAVEDKGRLLRLERVAAPKQFPFLLTATLPPDWERLPRYQRLTR